ncbi:MAG: transketolase family protein [Actinobacteria bacterium]|nr:transketolase family protein [Actinomycetota bacterium]
MIREDAHLVSNLFAEDLVKKATRDGYGEGLLELGGINNDVWALCGDLTTSTRAKAFAEAFPDRFVEAGVAEQNMAGIAAGLALEGKIPFASSFACFSPGRNWDQIRVSIAYSEANVKIASSHTGLEVGGDGASHQACEDIAMMRALPNFIVVAPCDAIETKKAVFAAAEHVGPVYIRFAREKTALFTTGKTPFEIGRAVTLTDGDDAAIIACGTMVYLSLLAAKSMFDSGMSVRVVDMHTIKPLDEEIVVKAASECGCIVTVEEHQVYGGLGGAVAEVLGREYPVPLEIIGVNDLFGESGKAAELWEKYGLTSTSIAKATKKAIKRKGAFGKRRAA